MGCWLWGGQRPQALGGEQISTPSSRRAQQLLAQSASRLHSARQVQDEPKQVQACVLKLTLSRQQSASRVQVCPVSAKQAAVLAQKRGMLQARVPSVSDTQQPLMQSLPDWQAAVQTVPTPVSRTHRLGLPPDPGQQSLSVIHASPGLATQRLRHTPVGEHDRPAPQVPQSPPQPSGPQLRPPHAGTQVCSQRPAVVLQVVPPGQLPHVPPQPSGPQVRPVHCCVQH